ncbi:MAG: CoA transferase [Rhodospirillaceae bacterium]|nr:CoA transferase [Rhodospirillaceae bacterium]
MTKGPLSGIRVIDLTRILAGPLCTMNLGDMGAEIIKIEQPGRGDDTRGWGPPFVGGEAAYFLGINRNKRSLTLNLKEERGKEILRALLSEADVLVENFKSGTLEGWGFTPEWMKENAPGVVHCAITGYGDQGPKGGMPGYDFLLQAESGLMSITGEKDGRPIKLGVAIVDVCTGQLAAMTILAALNSRHDTGRGQRIDLSLYNTSLSMLINVASNYLIGGVEPSRYGNGHPNIVPYNDFPCGDGEIALAVGNDAQFARFADCVGHPEWADNELYQSNANRVVNRDDIEEKINNALAKKSADEWIALFEASNIPCSKINKVSEVLDSEQTTINNMVVELDHPSAGNFRTVGIPYSFSETQAEVNAPPPLLGADTDDILSEMIGLDADAIAKLHDDGVI